MTKPEQVLIIEPPELRFRGPFTGNSVTSYMKLTNPTNSKVFFKIKTTAPKRYCVRPNCGSLTPQNVIQIAVTLQPFDFDPAEKNKHKFMVQSVIAADDVEDDYNDLWKDVDPAQVMESKLKCVFENPVSSTTAENVPRTVSTNAETTEEKSETVHDMAKPSPKILGETEEQLLKAAQEVNQLRVQESFLRKENLLLKEDLLRLRNAALTGNNANLSVGKGLASQSSNQVPLTSTHILLGIVIIIVGYLLGKMI